MTTIKSSWKTECWPMMRLLLRRNLPIGLAVFAVSFFCLPFPYILEVFRPLKEGFFYDLSGPCRVLVDPFRLIFPAMLIALPLALTLAQVYWMHSRRAVDLYHSLPVRREWLLLANAGAVFLPIAVPVGVNYLIVAVAAAIRQFAGPAYLFSFFRPGELLLDYLGWMVTALALIAVALLVATQVGSVFENLVFTGVLLCAPAGIYWVCAVICSAYLPGYGGMGHMDEVLSASPLTMMALRYVMWKRYELPPSLYMWWLIPLWGLAAVLLLWAACRLYKTRPSELAETSGAREPLNTLGRLGLVCIGGLAVAVVIHEVFRGKKTATFWQTALVCTALAAVVCQLVLNRGFRGMKKALPGMAAAVAVCTVFAFGMSHGGFGYTTYIPKNVESVTIPFRGRYGQMAKRVTASSEHYNEKGEYSYNSTSNSVFTTPEGIALVKELHRTLAQRSLEEKDRGGGYTRFGYSDGTVRYFSTRSGGSYFFAPRAMEPLLTLEESRALREQTDPRFTLTLDEVKAVRVTDATGLATAEPITDREVLGQLVEAMRRDAEEFDPTVLRDGRARAIAYITVETILPRDEYWGKIRIDKDCWRSFCLPVYPSDTHTYDILWNYPGTGELTDRLHDREAVALDIEWWGDPAFLREAYWVGTGPENLFPTRTAADPLPVLESSAPHLRIRITNPDEIREILNRCRGRDCHRTDAEGFIVTVQGADRTGCSFWLDPEEATEGIRSWYKESNIARYLPPYISPAF